MDILKLAELHKDMVIGFRHHLHQFPELSDQEFETLKYIQQQLNTFRIRHIEVKHGGILGFLGNESRGKTVLLRADIDALPMQEAAENTKQPKICPVSKTPGIAHTCGHDAHTAMLLTAAKILKDHEGELPGRIILCFERGEEGGHGMEYLLRHLQSQSVTIDSCHALHVAPSLPAGKIAALYGPATAGNFAFDITLSGKGGHGSRPDQSNHPLDCFHAIYSNLQSVWMRDIAPNDPATLSICKVECGTTWNIIPTTLNFSGTGRFFNQKTAGTTLRTRFLEIIEASAKLYHCTYTINYMKGPTYGILNTQECIDIAKAGIKRNIGPEVLTEGSPEFASESMALMMQLYPGAYCMLGTGNPDMGIIANPHNPMFDIDETALPIGVAAHISYAMEFLRTDYKPNFTRFRGTVEQLLETIP